MQIRAALSESIPPGGTCNRGNGRGR